MKIIIAKTYEEMSRLAAEEIAKVVNEKPNAVLGLATGGTPVGMYKELIDMYKEKKVDFSEVTSVNLDEYVGLSGDHNQSYRYFMNSNFFDHVNIRKDHTFVPNGLAKDINAEGAEYDKKIEALGGIDIQLVGIGSNGHIGFNEPGEELDLGTHLTNLTESTIEANARFFASKDEVPTQAVTMGLGGIMKAKKILLIANGVEKAEAINKVINGKITTQIPASMVQMHRDVVVVVDEAAASKLENVK